MIDKTHHVDTMRELTVDELDGVSGGGLYLSLYAIASTYALLSGGCPPTASYAPLCPN